jgi:ring-1,2-phenylacetyl-CoA epoxidase subunit PaaB
MTDTQWPVYEVFERPAIGRPMRAAGSVHAADAEMAQQNAWAVYGRRPTAVALWVVPRCRVLMITREEFCSSSPALDEAAAAAPTAPQAYCVFRRSGSKIAYEEAPVVVAACAQRALAQAVAQFNGEDWQACWVFPVAAITSSESTHGECSFAPQQYKWFRDHKSFPVGALLRDAREHAEENDGDDA